MKQGLKKNHPIHRVPFGSTVGNLLQFNKLKKTTVSSDKIITSTDRVLFIIDCPQFSRTVTQDIAHTSKIVGENSIRLLSLESVLAQKDCPSYLTPISLVGKGLTSSSTEFKDAVHVLQQFDPTVCVMRTEKPHGAVRRLLLKLIPEKRIAFGSLPPYPLRNISFPDFESQLSDYL